MEEAHDLLELKELISRLGLKDDRRQSPRYNVSIAGNYHADQGKTGSAQGRCWLIDVSKEGISVKLSDSCVKAGSILHLELPMGSRTVGVSARVVHVQAEEECCIVGLKATSPSNDIIRQLFSN